jgi:hypothetical protein
MPILAAWTAPATPEPAVAGQPAPAAPKPADPPAPKDGADVGGLVVKAPKAEPQWSKELNLDPSGDFAREKQPYYARPLTNGCRLTALVFACKKTF